MKDVYELTDEIHKALSSTGYTGKSMKKDSDISMFKNIIDDVEYESIGDRNSKHNTFS